MTERNPLDEKARQACDASSKQLERYTGGMFGTFVASLLAVTVYYSSFTVSLTDDPSSNIKRICTATAILYKDNAPLRQLTVAQAILESNLTGTPSRLAKEYNNLFGIKGNGTKGSIELPTKEHVKGKILSVNEIFAWNHTLYDSILQHEQLLQKPRYAKVRECKTFICAATEIKNAGYATDSGYTKLLLSTWKTYGNYCQ